MFWFDGSSWHVSAGLVEHCQEQGIDDLFFESGTPWCLDDYLFGAEFIPEAMVDEKAKLGFYKPDQTPTRDEDLAKFSAAFARHPKPV